MTSSINKSSFPKNMNLSIIHNCSKLSSFEQKNLAILILVRYKLAFFVKENPNDDFINILYLWLEKNVLDFKDIDIAFSAYFNTKEGSQLKNELFKIVKPLEELAVYLSKLAELNNNIKYKEMEIDNSLVIKVFTLNLLSYWFNRLLVTDIRKQTVYFKDILDFKFEKELETIIKQFAGFGFRNKTQDNGRKKLAVIFDSSFEIADFLFNYRYKVASVPIRGARKKKTKSFK